MFESLNLFLAGNFGTLILYSVRAAQRAFAVVSLSCSDPNARLAARTYFLLLARSSPSARATLDAVHTHGNTRHAPRPHKQGALLLT
jgi:hypothetical protein